MSHSRTARAALRRALVVLATSVAAVVLSAGTSSAAASGEIPTGTSSSTVSAGPAVAGLSVGTFTWAVVGLLLLVCGFVAASRSGRRSSVSRPDQHAAESVASFQSATRDAHGESTSVVAV